MFLQLLIVLAALYIGSRYGSLALGAISGIGLAILVLGFGLEPGTPPTDVIYIIIALSPVPASCRHQEVWTGLFSWQKSCCVSIQSASPSWLHSVLSSSPYWSAQDMWYTPSCPSSATLR